MFAAVWQPIWERIDYLISGVSTHIDITPVTNPNKLYKILLILETKL